MGKPKMQDTESNMEQEEMREESGSEKEQELFPPKLTVKEKIKKMLPKLIGFIIIVGISAACSNIRFSTLGHDFFMRFYNAVFDDEQEGDVTSLYNTTDDADTDSTETDAAASDSVETEAAETEVTEDTETEAAETKSSE